MTPRTMEKSLDQVFSDLVLRQSLFQNEDLHLSEHAPIIKPLHPKMLKALLSFMDNPGQDLTPPAAGNCAYFASVQDAKLEFPSLPVLRGFPYALFQVGEKRAIYDFHPFGVVVAGQGVNPSVGTPGLHALMLPPLFEYALSDELWGTMGKWTRFHERLSTLFSKYKLLNGTALPGRYPLDLRAESLEKKGVIGARDGESYVLTLPWTFSLSSLEKLTSIVEEEF